MYVIDTNVVMRDCYFYKRYDECLVPLTVVRELDNHKTDVGETGKNVRSFFRLLDSDEVTNVRIIFDKDIEDLDIKNDDKIITYASTDHRVLVTGDRAMLEVAKSMGVATCKDNKEDQTDRDNYNVTVNLYETEVVDGETVIMLGNEVVTNDGVSGIKGRNDEQIMALDALCRPDIELVVLEGIAGTGKSQPLSEKVLTPRGFVNMGDIEAGDYVVGSDGNPTKVLSIHPQGELEVFEVQFSDGSSTRCSIDHLWTTKNCSERYTKKEGKVRTTREIKDTLTSGKNAKKNHSIAMVSPVELEAKDVPLDAYLLGILLGDGHFAKHSIMVSSDDSEIIQSFSELLPPSDSLTKISSFDYLIKRTKRNNKRSCTKLIIEELGLNERRSNNKFIPEIYLYNSLENRVKMLQGLMDSDGTLDYRTGKVLSYCTVSKRLCEDIVTLVQSLGGNATVSQRFPKYTYKGDKKTGQLAYNITIKLPKEIVPFKLKRKADVYVPNEKYVPIRFITDVVSVGFEDCQCIKVEAEDSLYVTKDFIVTHNTICAVAAAIEQVCVSRKYEGITIARPTITMGEELGFLPGTLEEKLRPFLNPIIDNLRVVTGSKESAEVLLNGDLIEAESLGHIRGRSIAERFMIIDEAQNCTIHDIKAILTRAGEGTKIVLVGDPNQIDNPRCNKVDNGISYVVNKFKDQKEFSYVKLVKGERSRLAELAAKLL